ncbi:hypothetical protein JL720_16236 [Aureococcus anophagefferens]|nr:hypothetical protein JL720_16236 [Aureococcus anophagefferens]
MVGAVREPAEEGRERPATGFVRTRNRVCALLEPWADGAAAAAARAAQAAERTARVVVPVRDAHGGDGGAARAAPAQGGLEEYEQRQRVHLKARELVEARAAASLPYDLADDHGVLCCDLDVDRDWRAYFRELWTTRRFKWGGSRGAGAFSVGAMVRFRRGAGRAAGETAADVFLPLHQRLQLRRLGHETGLADEVSRRLRPVGEDARRRGAAPPRDAFAAAANVSARVVSTEPTRVLVGVPGSGLVYYDFARAQRARRRPRRARAAAPLVRSFCDGLNNCLLAYGQTGSGKTHMFGPPGALSGAASPGDRLGARRASCSVPADVLGAIAAAKSAARPSTRA